MNTKEDVHLLTSADQAIKNCSSIHDLVHKIKPEFLGKGSLIFSLKQEIKISHPENKKILGARITKLSNFIESAISKKIQELEVEEVNKKLINDKIDGTIPISLKAAGKIHPITFAANQILDFFIEHGFAVNTGPEIEDDFHNFTALNIPHLHPARQMHDTFYLNDVQQETNQNYLLRTHTTTTDIRAIKNINQAIKTVSFGRTFRCDSDRTHSPMFHQIEMLQVGQDVNMSNLKFYIQSMLEHFFETDSIDIRLRPSFFPFTKPGAEVDIRYRTENGKIIVDKDGDSYMEILGCGMLHPNVLSNCKIDPNQYQAIAMGLGVERMAMLKYQIGDIRDLFGLNHKWINHYGFNNTEW